MEPSGSAEVPQFTSIDWNSVTSFLTSNSSYTIRPNERPKRPRPVEDSESDDDDDNDRATKKPRTGEDAASSGTASRPRFSFDLANKSTDANNTDDQPEAGAGGPTT